MVTEKEISATEKLLDVIRKGDDRPFSDSLEAEEAVGHPGPSLPGQEKKSLSFSTNIVVGVEIQADTLRVVKMAKVAGTWHTEQALTVASKTSGAPDHPEFIALLRQTLQRVDGIKKARIWTLIPTDKGENWQISIPPIKKDIHNAVFWTAKREKGFDEGATAFDYRILGETTDSGAKKLAVEIFTAPREEVGLVKRVFARAGFPLEGITLSSFALQNLLVTRRIDPGAEAFAVLFIGQHSSAIDIHHAGHILLSRVIKTGLESMAEDILDTHGHMPNADAPQDLQARTHALKLIARLEEGEPSSTASTEDVQAMIQPTLERLARQVERTIDHSSNVLGHPTPTRLYLCGRLASAPGVVGFFHEQLGLKTIVLDPLHPAIPHIASGITSLNGAQRIALALATGVAMSSNDITPNFLFTAQDREKQKIVRRNGTLVGIGFLALALITAVFLFQARQELADARRQIHRVEQKLDAQTPLLTPNRINRMAADYLKRTSTLRGYAQKFTPVAVLAELSAITPPNIRLLNVRLEMDRPETKQARFLVLEGFIKEDKISFETHLSSYLFRIRSSPLFGDTAIQDSKTVDFESEGQVLRFVIHVNLKQVTHERT